MQIVKCSTKDITLLAAMNKCLIEDEQSSNSMNLKELEIGRTATVKSVGGSGALRQHFLDMGLIPGSDVTVIKYAPMGDPIELMISGYELTIRLADAEQIEIENVRKASADPHSDVHCK